MFKCFSCYKSKNSKKALVIILGKNTFLTFTTSIEIQGKLRKMLKTQSEEAM